MNLLDDLKWRGLIHQSTEPAIDLSKSQTLYAGFDPTADSLHVGHLMAILMLRRFEKAGHRPIVLLGGATGMIGDPSGKSEERNLISQDVIEANIASILQTFDFILDSPIRVNNHWWTRDLNFLSFLRDVGKNFPVNVMLSKDSVKSRLETGLSYTEFSYMLLQAYDFVYLNEQYGCTLQIGGSDQWGNITAGIDLARRTKQVQLYGLTFPLLTKSDGSKMGKTESGAIWLSPHRTNPYEFYQFWYNTADADVGKCLRFFTELSHEEILDLDAEREKNPGNRASQKRLAEEITRIVHGEGGLETALRATNIFFGGEIDLNDAQLKEIFSNVPSCDIVVGTLLSEAICKVGLAKSKSEARRSIEHGGIYVNNRRVTNDISFLKFDCAAIVIRSGKSKYALLKVTE